MSDHGSNCSIEEIGTEELEEGLQSPEASPEVSGVVHYFYPRLWVSALTLAQ